MKDTRHRKGNGQRSVPVEETVLATNMVTITVTVTLNGTITVTKGFSRHANE